jgi:hypothetical protein
MSSYSRTINAIPAIFEGTLTLDNAVAYAAGDVLSDTLAINLPRMPEDGSPLRGEITHIQVLDEDAQGIPLDVVFLRSNQSLGTRNAAVSISDVNAREIVGIASILAGDYDDLVGSKQALAQLPTPIVFELPATPVLYVGTIIRGVGTYTTSGVRVRVGIKLHNVNQY